VSRAANQIRVLLADMVPMLRDIVTEAVTYEPDLEVVGAVGGQEEFLTALERERVDVLVLGAHRPDDLELAEQIWVKSPRVKVLMIATGGRTAVLYALRPHKVVLGDVSPQGLVAAIRGQHPQGLAPS
jgi:DNA-binding NarL/FixJ family response regulator